MIQHTICLIGNTSEFISQTRQSKILENLDASWSKYEQHDFSDSKEMLFGENFQLVLTSKVEKETALAKAVVASKHSKEARGKEASNSHRRDGHGCNQFFSWEPCYQVWRQAGQEFLSIQPGQEEGEWLPSWEILLIHQKHTQSLFHDEVPATFILSRQISSRSNHPNPTKITWIAQLGIRHKHHYQHPVGGRLHLFRKNWEKVTQDGWILHAVQDLKLEFFTIPPYQVMEQPRLDTERTQALSNETNELL